MPELPILSLKRDATGTAKFLLPAGHSTDPTKYRLALRPRDPQAVFINMEEEGIKADATLDNIQKYASGTDNALKLLALRDRLTGAAAPLTFRQQPHYVFAMPHKPTGGITAYSNNRWFKFRSATLDLNGGALLPIFTGTNNDNMLQRSLYNGEMLQYNVDSYEGTKEYMLAPKIKTVAAGSRVIYAQTPSELNPDKGFKVGAWIEPFGKEIVFRGYPPGAVNFEREGAYITAIDTTTGRIELDRCLKYDYRADWPDAPLSSGSLSGVGRIIPLDNPEHVTKDSKAYPANYYSDYAEFRNGTMMAASADPAKPWIAPEAFAFIAKRVVLRRITTNRGTTPTECIESWDAYDCDFQGEMELDKLVGDVTIRNSSVGGYLSNGGGCKSFSMYDGRSDRSLQVASPKVLLDGVTCNARPFDLIVVTKKPSGEIVYSTQTKEADPAVAPYPGAQVIEEYRVRNLTFSASSDSESTAYLDPAMYLTRKLLSGEVEADGRIRIAWDGSDNFNQLLFWKSARVGTPIFTEDGTKGGRITSILYEAVPNPSSVVGYFYVTIAGATPAANETWMFSNLLNFIDEEGHCILTPNTAASAIKRTLYGYNSLRWKGNKGGTVNAPGVLTVTKDDLLLDGNGAFYFLFCGFVEQIELQIERPATSGSMKVALLDRDRSVSTVKQLITFSLASTALRRADAASSVGLTQYTGTGDPGIDQYVRSSFGLFANNIQLYFNPSIAPVEGLPDFKLIITPRYY